MANHRSALKGIRSSASRRLRNRFQAKTTRTYIRRLRASEDKAQAEDLLKTVTSMLDRLAKRNIIHKKKADNNKSKLAKHVAKLA